MGVEGITTTRNTMDLGVSRAMNAHLSARGGAARPSTTSHACSSVRSAAGSASVFLLVSTATRQCAPATTTGRPRKEDPSALKFALFFPFLRPLITLITMLLHYPLGANHILGVFSTTWVP